MKKVTGSVLALVMGFSALSASYAMADAPAPADAPKAVFDAGKGPKHEGPGRGRHGELFADLNLSAEQKAKLKEIRERHSASMHEETLAVLTPEQKVKFEDHFKNRPKPPEFKRSAGEQPSPPKPLSE